MAPQYNQKNIVQDQLCKLFELCQFKLLYSFGEEPTCCLNQKGDAVKCSPDVEHWHGASPDSRFTHIAIGPNLDRGGVVWLDPVTDEEYIQPME